MQIGGDRFRIRISVPTPWCQNPCDASIFLHARPNLKEKIKKSIFRPKFDLYLESSPPKYKDVFKKFLYGQMYLVGTAKISLKNLHSFWSKLEKI